MTVPSPQAPPPGRAVSASPSTRRRQILLSLVPILSLGFLTFVPFLVIALMRQRRRDWVILFGYVAAVIVMVALISVVGSGQSSGAVGGLVIMLMGVGATHSFVALRPDAGGALAPPGGPPSQQAVLHAARAHLHQRAEARKLCTANPVLARDLKIGRPDLPRTYDDGGLVDVNHVDAGTLVKYLSLTPQDAAAVITARDQLGGKFTSADEVSTYANLRPDCLDDVADLMVFS